MDLQSFIQSGLLEAYVLGQCSAEERAQVERMAAEHAEVRAELSAIEASLEAYAAAQAVLPPDWMKTSIHGTDQYRKRRMFRPRMFLLPEGAKGFANLPNPGFCTGSIMQFPLLRQKIWAVNLNNFKLQMTPFSKNWPNATWKSKNLILLQNFFVTRPPSIFWFQMAKASIPSCITMPS